uniref:Trafficking protein particle complex subunit 2-like protein n=1 Tax=Plectus sambesii TaxID=2011161 RepID=A0A914XJU2_9BILA
MAICVAVIDKDSAPLLIECALSSSNADERKAEQLRLHFFVHCALDIVDEKLNPAASSLTSATRSTELRELYLGALIANEDYKAFGYATNTRVKFVLVVGAGNNVFKDQDVRAIFKRLHSAYCDAIANPFHAPGEFLASRALIDTARDVLVKS